jgi:hypothetical protein
MADSGPVLHRDAAIATDCLLLVPMRLQALSVPQTGLGDATWADLTPNYNAVDRYQLRPQRLFAPPSKPPAAEPGVHLHWTLPAAFTHIEQKKGETATFPAVPNRWLVVRLWEEPPGQLRYRAQVVESDYIGTDGTSPWLKLVGEPAVLFSAADKIGRAVDLDKYAERRSAFTAVAPGNLGFASFYPSCQNVFGYYDAQSGTEQRVYSYFVVGWFADPANDPLAKCENTAEWLGRMGKLGWTVPENTKALPKRIVCHGLIQAHWPRPVDSAGGFPSFKLAVGNSAIEAIAAFVRAESTAQTTLRDQVLGQLQFALLQDRPPAPYEVRSEGLKQRRQLTSVRSTLHEKAFTALPGGTRWEIDQPSRNGAQPPRQNPPVIILTPQLAKCLSDLNRRQRDYDLGQQDLAALQREIYFQLRKKRQLVPMFLRPEEKTRRSQALQRRIDEAKPKVVELKRNLGELKTNIERIVTDIRDTFKNDSAWSGHILVPRPMPRYWRPNDPTLLLAGAEIPAIQGGRLPLICRVTGQTVSSFSPQNTDFGTFEVQADDLKNEDVVKQLSTGLPAGSPTGIAELLCEALLLDPQRVRLLAGLAHRAARRSIDELAEPVRNRLASYRPGDFTIGNQRASDLGASTAFGAARSATVFETSPFKPVFMMWEARYLQATGQNGLGSWRLDADDVDYTWPGSPPDRTATDNPTNYAEYRGYAPLGDSVGRGLKTETRRPSEIDRHTEGHLVVQSLGGFVEALLMHDATVQPPPLKEEGNTREIDKDMREEWVGEQYAVAPLAEVLDKKDQFFPIRGGHLVLNRLWIVDTFGRVRRVVDDWKDASISISHSLTVANSRQHIRLPARLAQPARLLFRWLSAKNDEQEFLGDNGTQPICGWVIHNRFDRSLLICNAAGRPLGAVQSVIHPEGHDRRGISWAKHPLQPIEVGDIPNRHLRGFVRGLLNLADASGKTTSTAFEDFLRLITHIEDNEPRQSVRQDLSVLMGRPLALVRASLRLDLLGPPAADQSWAQLDTGATAVPAFTETEFEVRLGNRRKGPDGLIGYFPTNRDGTGDFALIRLAQHAEDWSRAAAQTDHQYFRANQAVRVICAPNAQPPLLTLLLDPHLGVHVSSGILPTKVIDLPADLVADALSQLELPFLVAPVLGERQPDGIPNIPLPGDMPGQWIWTWRPKPDGDAKFAELARETTPARSLFKTMALYEGWLALRPNQAERT